MFEPRGHDVMSGSILYPPTRDDCDIAILFIETSGCLPMCGHGTIGTVTMAIENGLMTPKTPGVLRLDVPAGMVVAEYTQDGEYVEEVRITNVPCFLYSREGSRSMRRGSASSGRRRLWRQFLLHRRAAGELSRHRRSCRPATCSRWSPALRAAR